MMSQAAAQPRATSALRALGVVRHYAPDQPLFREGDLAKNFMQLATGVARSASLRHDGRRYVEAFYLRGDIFGVENSAH
jgi:CRP-like cAMP-binding protein